MIRFDEENHNFSLVDITDPSEIRLDYPLSVSLQVTRECNLRCVYCSEIGEIPTPSIEIIKKMVNNLKGVKRVIITGGEPLLRSDLDQIINYCKEMDFDIISLATNGVLLSSSIIEKIKSFVDYVDITIDGSRNVHNKMRGSYDTIINGILSLRTHNIPFSIVTVLYRENMDSILFTCQIADILGAKKLKILTPISKGKGKEIIDKSLTSDELSAIFGKIKKEKERNGWAPKITLVDWSKVGDGHAILVHPNGDVAASPVSTRDNCIHVVGNLLESNIQEIWETYPYKENHLRKYLEESLYVC